MSDILSGNPDVLVWFHRLVTLKTETEITEAISKRDKQIRQQIGRELLSKADLLGDKEGVYTAVKTLDIREVCQLEEE